MKCSYPWSVHKIPSLYRIAYCRNRGMFGKSIGTILAVVSVGFHNSRRHGTSAFRTSFLKTIPSCLFSVRYVIGTKHFSSESFMALQAGTINGVISQPESYKNSYEASKSSYRSGVQEWREEDVSFINSSVAKTIDDDLMFNNGSTATLILCWIVTLIYW